MKAGNNQQNKKRWKNNKKFKKYQKFSKVKNERVDIISRRETLS